MISKAISISFAVFFSMCCYSCTQASGNMTLELVQVIFRHGARTPSQKEASLINITDSKLYGPGGFHQLTNKGKSQAYKLGCKLRERYDKFLGVYKHNEVSALTTGHTRTKMSLELVLAGLYPPSKESTWNSKLNWTPIAFNQNPSESDVLLAPHQCPKFEELRKNTIASSEEYKKIISSYSESLRFIEKHTGIAYEDNIVYYSGWTYYVTKIHKMLDLQLPSWWTDDISRIIEELFAIGLDTMSWTRQLKRLNGGTLVKKVIENIEANKNNGESTKIYLYSTHDLTLAAFTRALNIETFKIPEFGSAIIVEKYRDSRNEEYIRMLSWDGSSENFDSLAIGSCGLSCPLDDYMELVKDVIPTEKELDFLLSD